MMTPGVSMGDALQFLERKSREILPEGFSVDYDGQLDNLLLKVANFM